MAFVRRYDSPVLDQSSRTSPRVIDVVLYFVGVAGLAAAITLVFLGMRAVMDVGGMCAEGGPYTIRQHCPQGTPAAMLLGIFGGLAALFLAAWKGSSIGGGAGSVVFLAWPGLFGPLGFNFLQYGFVPPGNDPAWDWSWLTCGILFEAMAFGPLLLATWAAPAAGVSRAAHVARVAPGGHGLVTTIAGARVRRSTRRNAIESAAPMGTVTRTDQVTLANPAAPMDPGAAGTAGPLGGSSSAAHPGEARTGTDVLVGALERLAALHANGSLTDDEYSLAKTDLLGRTGS